MDERNNSTLLNDQIFPILIQWFCPSMKSSLITEEFVIEPFRKSRMDIGVCKEDEHEEHPTPVTEESDSPSSILIYILGLHDHCSISYPRVTYTWPTYIYTHRDDTARFDRYVWLCSRRVCTNTYYADMRYTRKTFTLAAKERQKEIERKIDRKKEKGREKRSRLDSLRIFAFSRRTCFRTERKKKRKKEINRKR